MEFVTLCIGLVIGAAIMALMMVKFNKGKQVAAAVNAVTDALTSIDDVLADATEDAKPYLNKLKKKIEALKPD